MVWRKQRSLKDLKPTLKKSDWTWPDKQIMGPFLWEKLRTAHDWNKLPSELGICDPEDDADYMIAFSNTQAKMTSWERHVGEEDRANKAAIADAKSKV